MYKFMTSIPRSPFILMTELNSIYHFFCKCSPQLLQISHVQTRGPSCFSQAAAPVRNSKHMDVPCCNWSFGMCKAEICLNCCKHGICCICGKGHQEQRIMSNALPSSNLTTEHELLGLQEDVTRFVKKGPVCKGNLTFRAMHDTSKGNPKFL